MALLSKYRLSLRIYFKKIRSKTASNGEIGEMSFIPNGKKVPQNHHFIDARTY